MNGFGIFMDRVRKCPICDAEMGVPRSAELRRDKKDFTLFHATATFYCEKCKKEFTEKEDLRESEE